MMPQLVTVRVTRPGHRRFRLWIPVLPVALVLSPVVILIVIAAIVACLFFRVSPMRALGTCWRVISALPGTRFGVEADRTAIHIAIR